MGKFRLDAGPKPDRRAIELEGRLNQPGDAIPVQDPAQSQNRNRNSFNAKGFIAFGRVVDVVAYARVYKVQCEAGLGHLRCCDAAMSGLGVVGPRQINSYTLGQGVLVYYHPKSLFHVILCAVPDWMASARDGVSDYVFQGSNVGLQVDQAHNFPYTMQKSGGVIDFSAGRPSDSLPGDLGIVSSLGGRVFADDFQVQLAIDEETGVFLCYFDQYARFSGHNMDIRSAGYVREDRDDESEFSSVEGYTPFFWESLGLYGSSDLAATELTAADCQQASPNRTRLEPISDRQLGINREVIYHGYLGQGGKHQVVAPVALDAIHTYDSAAGTLIGLSDETRAIDGAIGLRSARGIYLAKMPLLPAPKRTDRPESLTGDSTATNYASCGQFGAGPPHIVAADPENNEDDPHVVEAAAILDLVSYLFNWKGLHPFHYHALDWAVQDESQMTAAAQTAAGVPDFSLLANQTFLPQAPAFNVQVDDRYGLCEYYANIACWGLMPNGGIAQVDGWGTEQRSAAGTSYFFTPGDCIIGAGRNIVLQGANIILKGYDGVELSASQKAVRVKAGTDVMIMGGNVGCGGVLIESKSDGPDMSLGTREDGEDKVGGIVLRAKNTAIAATAKNIALLTNGWGDSADGHITIDAGAEARIITRSGEFHRHIAVYAIDVFPDTNNEYWPDRILLGAETIINGEVFSSGQIVTSSDVIAKGAVAGSEIATIDAGAETEIDDMQTALDDRDISATVTASLTDLTFFTDNTDVVRLEFYFRDADHLKSSDFTICEPVWAQIARSTYGVPGVWDEDVVTGDDHADSSPWPGHSIWFGDNYGQRDFNLFDPLGMHAVDRGSAYENAEIEPTVWVTMDGNWPLTS